MRQTARLVLVALAVVLGGCAGGTRTIDLAYTPAAPAGGSGVSGAGPARAVALASFVDVRAVADRIGVVKANGGDTVLVPSASLSEVVTKAVAARLTADGYRVTPLGRAWDPRGGTVPSANADLVVGGLIERFYGEADGNYIWAPMGTEMRLRVAVASPTEKRLIGISVIRANLDDEVATSANLPDSLRDRFRAAIEQVSLASGLGASQSGITK